MIPNISTQFDWNLFSPQDGHYFFGYYDRNPWSPDGKKHLCMKVDQCERLPRCGEIAEIGLLDRDDPGHFEKITTTQAWCHQQGCMELFLPHRPGCFVYNDYDAAHDRIVARIWELGKGVVGEYALPIYAISPDGQKAVSLDFARIPRRGYSYAYAKLSNELWPANLDQTGLSIIDLASGRTELLVSYREMIAQHPYRYLLDGKHIWLNHAIFNCDSSKVLWLLRSCEMPENIQGWQTFMYTASLENPQPECILPEVYWTNMISHQIWGRTPDEILVDADWDGRGHGAVVFDETIRPFKSECISTFRGPGSHMIFSPDGKYLLADSYPGAERLQHLYLIDCATGGVTELGKFRHQTPPGTPGEVRCDLHPRWSRDSKWITVDSIDSGKRAVYILNMK